VYGTLQALEDHQEARMPSSLEGDGEMNTLTRVLKGLQIEPDYWLNRGRYRVTKAQLKREKLEATENEKRGSENG